MTPEKKPWWQLPFKVTLMGFLVVAAFFLVTEHTAHAFGLLPLLLLLACPVMHFLHHGHGGHGEHKGGGAPSDQRNEPHQHQQS